MVGEGVLREDSYLRGEFRNTVWCGLLRSEWKAKKTGERDLFPLMRISPKKASIGDAKAIHLLQIETSLKLLRKYRDYETNPDLVFASFNFAVSIRHIKPCPASARRRLR